VSEDARYSQVAGLREGFAKLAGRYALTSLTWDVTRVNPHACASVDPETGETGLREVSQLIVTVPVGVLMFLPETTAWFDREK